MLALYAALALRFYLGRPGPIADLRPEVNAATLALKEEDKAWPLYRAALLALPRTSPQAVIDDLRLNRMPLPGEDGWEQVAAWLQANAAGLDLARQAAAKPGIGLLVGYPFSEQDAHALRMPAGAVVDTMTLPDDPGLIGMLLPHLALLREMALALGFDAQQAAADGDGARALGDIVAMLGLARRVRETPTVISDLVSISILSRTFDAIAYILLAKPDLLSDADLAGLRTGWRCSMTGACR